jgi:hypothetical protein
MSTSSVRDILSRAISDEAFAALLFSDAERALAGYELTPEERLKLKNMDRVEFDRFAEASPEERMSWWGPGAQSGV